MPYTDDTFWRDIPEMMTTAVLNKFKSSMFPSKFRLRFLFTVLGTPKNSIRLNTTFSRSNRNFKELKKNLMRAVGVVNSGLKSMSHSAALWDATIYMELLYDVSVVDEDTDAILINI